MTIDKEPVYRVFRVLAVLAALVAVAPGSVSAAESRFFSALGDVPLMQGVYELTRETVVFDKPEGRIVESAAVGENMQPTEIMAFYADILPRLGWIAASGDDGARHYLRQEEKLTLRPETRNGLNIVRFSLGPAP